MILTPSRFWQPPRSVPTCADTADVSHGRMSERGQALAEFALLVPLMLLLAVALGDFGRLFNAAIAIESAAREAADYGAMQGTLKWKMTDAGLLDENMRGMRTRACTAASTLSDYVGDPPGTLDMTCTNPTFAYDIEPPPTYSGDCSTQAEFDDPCIVHVTMTYDFHMFLNFPPLPSVIHMTRESRFAISDLGL
jgi:Flp pilus assembly protein TadG